MEKDAVITIVRTLNDHQVQYLIVGGLAVVAHGYVRFTADVDLVLSMESQNLAKAIAAVSELGYRPRAPVPIEQFADPSMRQRWAAEKNMVVFSLNSPRFPATEIDMFIDPPLEFSKAYVNAVRAELSPGISATFCSLEDLIRMKSIAGRQRDADDIDALRKIHDRPNNV